AQFIYNVAGPDLSTKEDAMDATSNPVTFRIVWCRRQRAKARTDLEIDAWRAEEEGLRDAVLRRDHVHKYRGRSPVLFERYVLGFQDAKALMRAAQVTRFPQSGSHRT
ncbi:MAG: hypothetical protein AAB308_00940, partial [Nitrospirota bacterium]